MVDENHTQIIYQIPKINYEISHLSIILNCPNHMFLDIFVYHYNEDSPETEIHYLETDQFDLQKV